MRTGHRARTGDYGTNRTAIKYKLMEPRARS